jgi:hypothetical protein
LVVKERQNKPSGMARSERFWVSLGWVGRQMVLPFAGPVFIWQRFQRCQMEPLALDPLADDTAF